MREIKDRCEKYDCEFDILLCSIQKMHSTRNIEQFERFHDRDACHHELDVLNMLMLSLEHDHWLIFLFYDIPKTRKLSLNSTTICVCLLASLQALMDHILEWETKYPSTKTARNIRDGYETRGTTNCNQNYWPNILGTCLMMNM